MDFERWGRAKAAEQEGIPHPGGVACKTARAGGWGVGGGVARELKALPSVIFNPTPQLQWGKRNEIKSQLEAT